MSAEAPIGKGTAGAAPRRKIRWKAWAILAAVFLLGAGAGAAAMRARLLSRWRATMTDVPAEARARFRLEAMSRRLDLTDEQRAKLETIFEQAEQERARLTEHCRPKIEALRARIRKQVDEVLTEEQRRKHHQMIERMRKRRGHHWGHRHDGPPALGDGPPPALSALSPPAAAPTAPPPPGPDSSTPRQ